MAPWLSIFLGLWLGQTPGTAPSPPPSAEAQREAPAELGAQLQELQDQQEETTANVQRLQDQLSLMQERAAQLEQMREQRLTELDRARSWLVVADQALAVGRLEVSDSLGEADSALARVSENATAAGNERTASLVQDARNLISLAFEAAERRDTGPARDTLFVADWLLREARRLNLDAPSSSLVAE